MAGAMLGRWRESHLDAASVTVVDPGLPDLAGVTVLPAIPADSGPAGRVLLGIKPQMLDAVAADITRLTGSGTLLISMLAGVRVTRLAALFPKARIVRIMPNLPVRLGKGVVTCHARDGEDAETTALMEPLGLVEWIDDEERFDAVTALSGCGPAFTYRFIDALATAGVALGLDPAQAARLALATVDGAAALAAHSPDNPAALAEKVASKGGATRAGLDILDRDKALDALLTQTLGAAARRSRALGQD